MADTTGNGAQAGTYSNRPVMPAPCGVTGEQL